MGYIQQVRSIRASGNSDFDYSFKTPLVIGPTLDMWIEVDTDSTDTVLAGGFTIIYKQTYT